jgi:hypothetical protein
VLKILPSMGHTDIETTRQYFDRDQDLKRKAFNRLSLSG